MAAYLIQLLQSQKQRSLSVGFSETTSQITLTVSNECQNIATTTITKTCNSSTPSCASAQSDIALSFGIYKHKSRDDGIPTPLAAHHKFIS
ncbi:9844_t:CDS:2 [Dentiscutata heterogama]|uniref:9844_t:CDS:1 n=1 Tax=Dentiscutata heterogama TaxID=1316150 RepID=A0ACA9L056_9GLOM|nr:9844_t:CDS:2 [Dentiscutata heterogama]